MIYFSSDLHLFHKQIIEYCNRPFKDVEEMDKVLIDNWNNKIPNDEVVYFLGDLTFGNGLYDLKKLNGNIILFKGNHDKYKGLDYGVINYSDKKIFLCHFPFCKNNGIDVLKYKSIKEDNIDIILCGHVHDKWKIQYYELANKVIPIINVSTDVWKYTPISIEEIFSLLKNEENIV